MEEDINTMHRYRDSLSLPIRVHMSGLHLAPMCFFPGLMKTCISSTHFYKSINEVNIGAFPFLPNTTTLVEQFIERLVKVVRRSYKRRGSFPKVRRNSGFLILMKRSLLALYHQGKTITLLFRRAITSIPIEVLKKGWQEAKYIALYVKNGVADIHGISIYGKIFNIAFVKDHQNNELAKFEVDYWRNLKQGTIRPVHYGIANYAMTTINILKEAKGAA